MNSEILEIVYYQLVEMENRLDKKIEYIKSAENEIKLAVLELKKITKELENVNPKRN